MKNDNVIFLSDEELAVVIEAMQQGFTTQPVLKQATLETLLAQQPKETYGKLVSVIHPKP